MANIKSPEAESVVTQEAIAQFSWDELMNTKRRDSRDAVWYLAKINSDAGLRQLISQKRCPLILTFSDNCCNIVFPAAPMKSRNKINQQITRLIWAEKDGSDRYVIHTTAPGKQGPRTICSYAVVSIKEAQALQTRIVAILTEKGETQLAQRYAVGHDLLDLYDTATH